MQAYEIVLIIVASFILLGVLVLITIAWRNRHNRNALENLNPKNYDELNKLSENLQEKLPVLDTKVENVAQTLSSHSTLLPKMDTKIDSLQQTSATEASMNLLKENLIRLEELTNKLDKKSETLDFKTNKNAEIVEKQMTQVESRLGKITSLDEKIATNLNVSMDQTKMIPTIDTKVETIKHQTNEINSIKENLKNLNNIVDSLNKITSSLSAESAKNNEENVNRLSEVRDKINDLTQIFTNDRHRGKIGENILNLFLTKYFGAGAKDDLSGHLWKAQYKVTNINNPHKEIGLVDAVVFTPQSNQNIAIDSKFPEIDYSKIFGDDGKINAISKKEFETKIKTKVKDLKKYIHPDNQIASVIMFIPSEDIYYFIATQCTEIMDFAYKEKIWLAGPTILMALLNMQVQIMKDYYFNKNIDSIREIVMSLKYEFIRFDQRATKLKSVYDKYVSETKTVFDSLETTQNKIKTRVSRLEDLNENSSTPEFLEANIQSEAITTA